MTTRSAPRSRSTTAVPSTDDDRQSNDSRRRSCVDTPPPVLQRIQDFRSPDNGRHIDQQVPAAASKDSAIARLLLDGRRPMLLLQQQHKQRQQMMPPSTPRLAAASHQSLKPASPFVDATSFDDQGHQRGEMDGYHRHRLVVPSDPQSSPVVDCSTKKSSVLIGTSPLNSLLATTSRGPDSYLAGASSSSDVASTPARRPNCCQSSKVESNVGRHIINDIQPQQSRHPHQPCDDYNDDSMSSSASLRALLLRRREPEIVAAVSDEVRLGFRAHVEEEGRCRSAYRGTKQPSVTHSPTAGYGQVPPDEDRGCQRNNDKQGASKSCLTARLSQRSDRQQVRRVDVTTDINIGHETSERPLKSVRRTLQTGCESTNTTLTPYGETRSSNSRMEVATALDKFSFDASLVVKAKRGSLDGGETSVEGEPVKRNGCDVTVERETRADVAAERRVATALTFRRSPGVVVRRNATCENETASSNVRDHSTDGSQRPATGHSFYDAPNEAYMAAIDRTVPERADKDVPVIRRPAHQARGVGDRNDHRVDRGLFSRVDHSRVGEDTTPSLGTCSVERNTNGGATPRQSMSFGPRPSPPYFVESLEGAAWTGSRTENYRRGALPSVPHVDAIDCLNAMSSKVRPSQLDQPELRMTAGQMVSYSAELNTFELRCGDSADNGDRSTVSSTLKRNYGNEADTRSAIDLARSRLPRKRFRFDETAFEVVPNGSLTTREINGTLSTLASNGQSVASRMTSSSSNKEDADVRSGGIDANQPIDFRRKCNVVIGAAGRDIGVQCDLLRSNWHSSLSSLRCQASGELRDCAGNVDGAAAAGPRVSTSPMALAGGGRPRVDVGAWCRPCGIWFADEVLHSIHAGCHAVSGGGGSNVGLFSCNVCGRRCPDRYAFNTHLIRGHEMSVNDEEENDFAPSFLPTTMTPLSASVNDNNWLRMDRSWPHRDVQSRLLPVSHHRRLGGSSDSVNCDVRVGIGSDVPRVSYQQSQLAEVS